MNLTSPWVRRHVSQLAIRYPALAAGLLYLFLYTVSNHIHFVAGMTLQISPFWHMLLMGAVMSSFAAILLYEVIRLHRQLAELRMVRSVASTLHHEINNPLMVIQLSAEKLQAIQRYDGPAITNILDSGTQIRAVVGKLSELDQEVRLRTDRGFEGLIDLSGSR